MVKKKTFETALKELEEIVKELESGNLSLEDAVKKYESGMQQSRFCLDLLDKAEKKISLISRNNDGSVKELSFEDE